MHSHYCLNVAFCVVGSREENWWDNSELKGIHQQSVSMVRRLVLDWQHFWPLVVVLLATVRGTGAQCSRASFEVPYICLNDKTCVSQTVREYWPQVTSPEARDPLTQGCSCLNGTEIGLDDVEDINGTAVRSLYVSGAVDSLEPFHRLFTQAFDAVICLRHTLTQSLQPLHGLERVGGLVIISNDRLINIAGLENLRNVTGPFIIYGNTNLGDVDGLQELQFLGNSSDHRWWLIPVWLRGSFIVDNNVNLRSVEGFHSLRSVWGKFVIPNCRNSTRVSEFERLEIVGGSLTIKNNTNLLSV